ncbi:MAG: non-ribosomal peptide synthetase, partial [bacterium]|nr:non-ribosomal peptide synthetase [bacterium]
GDLYLCAYIGTDGDVDGHRLRKHLGRGLPDYMIPSFFIPIEKLPLNVNGKVDKKRLPPPEIEMGDAYTPPENELEKKITDIWADVLKLDKDKIGTESNFFEIGGHSLKATRLVSKMHQELNVKVPLSEIFRISTVKALSQYVAGAVEKEYESIKPAEKQPWYPQSSAQKRLFFLDRLTNIGTTYNMPNVLKFNGPFDRERFTTAVYRLINRHEALRTSFGLEDDRAVQFVHELENIRVDVREIAPKGIDSIKDYIDAVLKEFIRPFELSEAPLFRVAFAPLPSEKQDGEHLVVYDLHHIISDG